MKRSCWVKGQELLGRGPWDGQDVTECQQHPAEQAGVDGTGAGRSRRGGAGP